MPHKSETISRQTPLQSPRIVAFIDIGTNSVRLFVVKLNPDCSSMVLTSQKEMVRLGDGEFTTGMITTEAMDRAVKVCGHFVELAHSFGAEEFVAVATSATREAQNRYDFLCRLRRESHLDVQVISGREEARLIFIGVSGAMHLQDKRVMVIDIGGGSTEIAVGGERTCTFLSSLHLGSIRLMNMFFPGGTDKEVPDETYEIVCDHVRHEIRNMIKQVSRHPFDIVSGSSGTIINLCDISGRLFHPDDPRRTILTSQDLRKTIIHLRGLKLPERRKVPGINPDRADIIIAGAAIIDMIMNELNIGALEITQRGLQDGLLADYLRKMDAFPLLGELNIRERSVLLTGRAFGINEYHARTVSTLALSLFDSAKEKGIHNFGDRERELLEYAAFLHDIGSLISFRNHHAHSYYIIRNSDLLGFDETEIAIIANITRFHRKKLPKRKDLDSTELAEENREVVSVLSSFLRLAESLDRRHAALINKVSFTNVDAGSALLEISARDDCQFESWGVENEMKSFERVFGRKLSYTIALSELDVPSFHERPESG